MRYHFKDINVMVNLFSVLNWLYFDAVGTLSLSPLFCANSNAWYAINCVSFKTQCISIFCARWAQIPKGGAQSTKEIKYIQFIWNKIKCTIGVYTHLKERERQEKRHIHVIGHFNTLNKLAVSFITLIKIQKFCSIFRTRSFNE